TRSDRDWSSDVCSSDLNGQPAKIEHFLKFNSKGPAAGELIFVSGSPGKTDRQLTLDELADTRDRYLPYVLNMFYRREVLESAYRSEERRVGKECRARRL